jgi:alpha-beta hydrolase superfamily lysophospholipase
MLCVARSELVVAVAALLALTTTGCGSSDEVPLDAVGQLDYAGRVERIETLGRYSSLDATLLLQLAGSNAELSTENDFLLYRVIYPTAAVHGGVTLVSGLVAVPASRRIKGIVSWQHGTNSYRPNSISKPSLPEGLGVAALFAGDGYITVAPDYIGLGVSTEVHPYYHWPSTVSTIVDLLSIAEIMLVGIAEDPDRDLFLAGFSQGGGATAGAQKFLQENNETGLRLRGAATISAAFNPREISLPHFIESDEPFFLAMILSAMSHVHGQSLEGLVRAPYADELADWFDGTHNEAFLRAHLPQHLAELVTDEFLHGADTGSNERQWFDDALRAAATYDYAPEAPLRIHFGSRDTIVIPEEARAAFSHMNAQQGNVELMDVGPYDHDEMVLQSLPHIQRWFDELDRSNH